MQANALLEERNVIMGVHNHWKGSGPKHCKQCARELQQMAKMVADTRGIPPVSGTPVEGSGADVTPQPDYQAMVEQVRAIVNPHTPGALRLPMGVPDGGESVSRDQYERYMEGQAGGAFRDVKPRVQRMSDGYSGVSQGTSSTYSTSDESPLLDSPSETVRIPPGLLHGGDQVPRDKMWSVMAGDCKSLGESLPQDTRFPASLTKEEIFKYFPATSVDGGRIRALMKETADEDASATLTGYLVSKNRRTGKTLKELYPLVWEK